MGPGSTQPDRESPEGEGGVITVVLADDAEDVRLMLRLSLQREGDIAVVGEAADGTQVVHMAATHQPDVVVLDLGMPGAGGVETVAAVHGAAPSAKIIVVSGQDRSSNWTQASAAGAAAYVQKGGRPSDIAALVRSLARG
jgi:DNA-binding NarL/FixJ family response regulator